MIKHKCPWKSTHELLEIKPCRGNLRLVENNGRDCTLNEFSETNSYAHVSCHHSSVVWTGCQFASVHTVNEYVTNRQPECSIIRTLEQTHVRSLYLVRLNCPIPHLTRLSTHQWTDCTAADGCLCGEFFSIPNAVSNDPATHVDVCPLDVGSQA